MSEDHGTKGVRSNGDQLSRNPTDGNTDCSFKTLAFQTFFTSFGNLAASLKGIFDAANFVSLAISSHLQTLSEIETHVEKHNRAIDNLQRELTTALDAWSIFLCTLDMLSFLDKNSDNMQLIITALEANNCDPLKLKTFVEKITVGQTISKILEAYQKFMDVYKPLEDSLQNECDQLAAHLSKVKYKKCDTVWNGRLWAGLLGGAAALFAGIGIAALTGHLAIGCGYGILVGLGFSSTVVCAPVKFVFNNFHAYSLYTLNEDKLKELHRKLSQIINDSKTLKGHVRDLFVLLQRISTKADVLLHTCDDQTQAKTLAMLNDMHDMNSNLQSKKAEV